MEINHSSKSLLNFLIPFLTAYFGSKGIFYLFSFEYSIFSDAFVIQKLLIDISVFGVLFYIGSIGAKHLTSTKNKSNVIKS